MKRLGHLFLTGFFLALLTPFMVAQDLVIAGVFDGDLSGGLPKGVELYAIADIPDLSIYGIGSANNGNGTNGIEFNFSGSAAAGDCIFVASDSMAFNTWFGFFPHFSSDAMGINGDDAIELFLDTVVIDVFGDINVDGNGTPWEYLDSWAYRVSGTGPDGSTFVIGNWTFGGVGAYDGAETNDGSGNPMPVCTYTATQSTEVTANDDSVIEDQGIADLAINVAANDIIPTGIASIAIISSPNSGSAAYDTMNNVILYNPNPDFCGLDTLTYELCDLNGSCDQASVFIEIVCTPEFIELVDDEAFGAVGQDSVLLDIFSNDILPDQSNINIFIITSPVNGIWAQDPTTFELFYYPNEGTCGVDSFMYEVCNLNINDCDTATVTINIECPTVYEMLPIADVTGIDTNGVALSLGMDVELVGTVYCIDFQANDNIQFTLHDGVDGISVFSTINYGYVVNEGDEVTIRGKITQYNGLTQVQPDQNDSDTLWMSGMGTLLPATIVTELNESTESELVTIENVTLDDPTQWAGDGFSFNVDCTDDMGNTFSVRIDDATEMASEPAPEGVLNITGIGGQFDSSSPYDSGYQLLPCSPADIVNDVKSILAAQFKAYPNPVNDLLYLEMDEQVDAVRVTNSLGQVVYNENTPANVVKLDTKNWVPGIYHLNFVVGKYNVTKQLVVQH